MLGADDGISLGLVLGRNDSCKLGLPLGADTWSLRFSLSYGPRNCLPFGFSYLIERVE